MSNKKGTPLPVDIKLPDGVLLENGVMFVTLQTLDELEVFWRDHESRFAFACEGREVLSGNSFLRGYEWVFGSSKAAIVRTIMRWGQSDIGCEFYDQSKHDPGLHNFWFHDRDAFRASQIQNGEWSAADEAEYLADCVRRTPESYRGWWQFSNLPEGYDPEDWFNPCINHEELFDPCLPPSVVENKLHEQTFNDWMESDFMEIEAYDTAGVDALIRYWQGERDAGRGYYGDENEIKILVPMT